jgi:hypothetical protein
MAKPPALKGAPRPAADFVPVAPIAVVAAIQALHAGEATPHQQQTALAWIVREAGGKASFPYHGSDRDTAFALGRLFVADLIVGLFNADLSSLRRDHVDSKP